MSAAAAAPPAPSAADLEDLEDEGASAAAEAQSQDAGNDAAPPPPPPPEPAPSGGAAPVGDGEADDQVSAALRKIASHIGSAKKFVKASQLLRELLSQVGLASARRLPHTAEGCRTPMQVALPRRACSNCRPRRQLLACACTAVGAAGYLPARFPLPLLPWGVRGRHGGPAVPAHATSLLAALPPPLLSPPRPLSSTMPACLQGAVRVVHGPLLFSALKAAMAEPERAADPLLAREYSKLFTAASKVAEVRARHSPAACSRAACGAGARLAAVARWRAPHGVASASRAHAYAWALTPATLRLHDSFQLQIRNPKP